MAFFPEHFGFAAAQVRRRQGHAVVVVTGGKTDIGCQGDAAGTGNDHRRRRHAEQGAPAFDIPAPFEGAVTAEDDGLAFPFQGIQDFRPRRDVDFFFRRQLRPVPAIDTGIDIAFLGVDEGADAVRDADEVPGQADRRRDADDRHVPGKGQAFGRGQADAQARKGTGADGNGDAVDLAFLDRRLVEHVGNMGHELFRMGQPCLDGEFSPQRVVMEQGDTRYEARCFNG